MSSILNMFEDDFEKSFSKVEEVDQGELLLLLKKPKKLQSLKHKSHKQKNF
jgi:hypothetical protein